MMMVRDPTWIGVEFGECSDISAEIYVIIYIMKA